MPSGTGLDISKSLPERTFDVGIAEQHAITFAAGSRPKVKALLRDYSTFLSAL